jgi:hypothetical protein
MLHATHPPLSIAEVRLVFVEAPNLTFLNIVLCECVSNLLFTGIVPFNKDGSLEERAEWERLQRAAINEAFSNFTRRIEQLPVWPFTESKAKFLHRLRRGRSDCLRLVTVFTDASCWGVHRSQWNHLDQRDYETVMDVLGWLKAVEAELADLESVATPLSKIITPAPTATPTPPTALTSATPDPFAALRQFAHDHLKGQQRRVLTALCDSDGVLGLEMVQTICGWLPPIESSWNSLRSALNQKLRSHGWQIRTFDRTARLVSI